MPTLQFKIEYPVDFTQTKAVYDKNYQLYKQSGITLNSVDNLNKSNLIMSLLVIHLYITLV